MRPIFFVLITTSICIAFTPLTALAQVKCATNRGEEQLARMGVGGYQICSNGSADTLCALQDRQRQDYENWKRQQRQRQRSTNSR